MIENEQTIQCALKHSYPIVSVILNPEISKDKRLLCNECLDNMEAEGKVVGFKKIIQMIEEQQNQKMNLIENIIIQNIKQIELIQSLISQMKSNIIQQLEHLNSILKDWMANLKSIGMKYSQYSFHEELENIINKSNNMKFNPAQFIKDISIENNNQNSKVKPKIDQYNQLPEYNECKKILLDLQVDIMKFELFQNVNNNQVSNTSYSKSKIQITEMPLLQEKDINLNLIDQSFKQADYCYSIVFNTSGSIMVSTDKKLIKVWNFNNGRIQLLQTLDQHKDWVNCLIYSRIQDAFLSGSDDKAIRIWKQKKENQWISSQSYQLHVGSIFCLISNQKENLLYSGGHDKSIKVWQLDISNDKLIYQYSLDKHKNQVYALSLNQSESLLVSCGNGENEIIIWERGLQNKMEFKNIVKQSISCSGSKIKFMKDNQFIWVPNVKDIDKIFIFELKEGVFQENQQKTISLNQNIQVVDMFEFPIIYNKLKNVIIVRHKLYIYIIRELNNGQFKIVKQLKFRNNQIYGDITNDGSYLVYWDNEIKFYSIYELLYQ